MDKNTCKYYGSHLWNLLPNDIKKCMDRSFYNLNNVMG